MAEKIPSESGYDVPSTVPSNTPANESPVSKAGRFMPLSESGIIPSKQKTDDLPLPKGVTSTESTLQPPLHTDKEAGVWDPLDPIAETGTSAVYPEPSFTEEIEALYRKTVASTLRNPSPRRDKNILPIGETGNPKETSWAQSTIDTIRQKKPSEHSDNKLRSSEHPNNKLSLFGKLKKVVATTKNAVASLIQNQLENEKYWKLATLVVGAALVTATISISKQTSRSTHQNPFPPQTKNVYPRTEDAPAPQKQEIIPKKNLARPSEVQTLGTKAHIVTPLEHGLKTSDSVVKHGPFILAPQPSLGRFVLGDAFREVQNTPEKTQQIIVSQPDKSPLVQDTTTGKPKTIPMYVISLGGKTIYITDRDNDGGLNVNEERLGYLDVVGGNYRKNTPKMYRMMDKMGLNSDNIRPGNMNTTITYSDIISGIPITKTLTVGETVYTISANNDLALRLGEEKLMGKDNKTHFAEGENIGKQGTKRDSLVASEKNAHSLQKSTPVRTVPIPRALPVPENTPKNIAGGLGLPPEDVNLGETPGVLPSLDGGGAPLPPLDPSIIPQGETRAMGIYAHMERNGGHYNSYSQELVPENPEQAMMLLEGILETRHAVNAYRMLTKKPPIPLKDFFEAHYTFVTTSANGTLKTAPMTLGDLSTSAHLTDTEDAMLLRKKMSLTIIDDKPYDKKLETRKGLEGTFDTNGWGEAHKLILRGAESIYGPHPTIPQLNEYFVRNVSFEKYPDIKTYAAFLQRVDKEESEQIRKEAVKQGATQNTNNQKSTGLGPLKSPEKQYLWVIVNTQKDMDNALRSIHREYMLKRETDIRETGTSQYASEQEFSDEFFRILDSQRRIIPYGAARMKVFPINPQTGK